jgi:acyl transferase domain-containing protein
MGGVNAHIVLEEAPPQPHTRPGSQEAYVLPISARSEAALLELAKRYHDFLAAHQEIALADLCYTASLGRAHFKHRAALVASSLTELRRALRGLLEHGPRSRQVLDTTNPRLAQLEQVARDYTAGRIPGWAALYTRQPQRIALPDYPFEREQFWFGEMGTLLEMSSTRELEPAYIVEPAPVRERAHPLRGRRQK